MDYQTIANIASEHAQQVIHAMKLNELIKDEIKNHADAFIQNSIEEKFAEIKENINILNKQILLLRDIVETINEKNNS